MRTVVEVSEQQRLVNEVDSVKVLLKPGESFTIKSRFFPNGALRGNCPAIFIKMDFERHDPIVVIEADPHDEVLARHSLAVDSLVSVQWFAAPLDKVREVVGCSWPQ